MESLRPDKPEPKKKFACAEKESGALAGRFAFTFGHYPVEWVLPTDRNGTEKEKPL